MPLRQLWKQPIPVAGAAVADAVDEHDGGCALASDLDDGRSSVEGIRRNGLGSIAGERPDLRRLWKIGCPARRDRGVLQVTRTRFGARSADREAEAEAESGDRSQQSASPEFAAGSSHRRRWCDFMMMASLTERRGRNNSKGKCWDAPDAAQLRTRGWRRSGDLTPLRDARLENSTGGRAGFSG